MESGGGESHSGDFHPCVLGFKRAAKRLWHIIAVCSVGPQICLRMMSIHLSTMKTKQGQLRSKASMTEIGDFSLGEVLLSHPCDAWFLFSVGLLMIVNARAEKVRCEQTVWILLTGLSQVKSCLCRWCRKQTSFKNYKELRMSYVRTVAIKNRIEIIIMTFLDDFYIKSKCKVANYHSKVYNLRIYIFLLLFFKIFFYS